jgi:hypothetical protein
MAKGRRTGRTVSSLKGAKMLKRTIGHRLAIKVEVKGAHSIREAKPMLRILRSLVANKAWMIEGIRNLELLQEIHHNISLANNILCDILRFTAPDFNAADATPPRVLWPRRTHRAPCHPRRRRPRWPLQRPHRAPRGLLRRPHQAPR